MGRQNWRRLRHRRRREKRNRNRRHAWGSERRHGLGRGERLDDQGTDAPGARGGPQPVRGKRSEVGFGGSGVANGGTIDAAPVSREQGRLLTASGVVRVCSGGVEEEVNSEDPDKDAERASAALIRGEDRAGQQATGGGIVSEPHVDALTGSSQEAQERGFEAD